LIRVGVLPALKQVRVKGLSRPCLSPLPMRWMYSLAQNVGEWPGYGSGRFNPLPSTSWIVVQPKYRFHVQVIILTVIWIPVVRKSGSFLLVVREGRCFKVNSAVALTKYFRVLRYPPLASNLSQLKPVPTLTLFTSCPF
jgi:hypothetical protein